MTINNNTTRRGAADPVAAARDLLRRGIMPLPLLPGEKNLRRRGWQNWTITEENLPQYFNGADLNVGVRMGRKSGGLRDVDLDVIEAIKLAHYFLPETDAIYGRDGKPRSHWQYITDDEEAKGAIHFDGVELVPGEGARLIDFLIGGGEKGALSVAPGSRHISGEFVRWDKDGAPARADYVALKKAITKLAVATMLLTHWPDETRRHDMSLGIGGFLARAGWQPEDVHRVVKIVCTEAGGADWAHDNARTAMESATAHYEGREARGLTWLKETWGPEAANALAKIVGYRGREAAPPVSTDGRPTILLVPGELALIADKGEEALIAAGVQFYERANKLVRPIIKEVDTFHGAKTTTAQFTAVDKTYMRDQLCRVASWHKLDRRSNAWFPEDVPEDIAATVLARAGEWHFPSVAGIVTMPTLRPDGTILDRPGYDPATRLLLVDSLEMPSIPDHPTKDDASAALKLITDLQYEFEFVDEVSKAVGVSAIVTPVARGAFPVAPMHAFDRRWRGPARAICATFRLRSPPASGCRSSPKDRTTRRWKSVSEPR
jgi:hypothetical protein